jgi:hypothetical protein
MFEVTLDVARAGGPTAGCAAAAFFCGNADSPLQNHWLRANASPPTDPSDKRLRNPGKLHFVPWIALGQGYKYKFILVLRVGMRNEAQYPATSQEYFP